MASEDEEYQSKMNEVDDDWPLPPGVDLKDACQLIEVYCFFGFAHFHISRLVLFGSANGHLIDYMFY